MLMKFKILKQYYVYKKPLRVLLSQQYARRKNDYEKINQSFIRKKEASQLLGFLRTSQRFFDEDPQRSSKIRSLIMKIIKR